MENKSHCGCKHIDGINCSVKNCYYHDGETYCTAGKIAVAHEGAKSSAETTCATFKPNDGCNCH